MNQLLSYEALTERIRELEAENAKRREAEDALIKTRAILEKAEEISCLGSYEADIKLQELYISEGWQRIHGVTKHRLTMTELMAIAYPDDRLMIQNAMKDAFNNIKPYQLEHRIIRQNDQAVRVVKSSANVILDAHGMPNKLYGSVQDITDTVHTMHELQESKEKYQQLFQLMDEGFVRVDKDSTIIMANLAIAEMFGYDSPSELIGLPMHELYANKTDRDTMIQNIQTIGILKNYELRGKTKQGYEFWTLNNIRLVKDDAGQLLYTEGLVRDITDRKRAEQTIAENEQKYRDLFEANSDALTIFRIYPDGMPSNILECNQNAANLVGYTKAEMLKLNPTDFEKNTSKAEIDERVKTLMQNGFAHFESKITDKFGQELDVEIKVLVIAYNNQPALLNILRNITERKQKEIQLQHYASELNRMNADKDRFISILAHDLKGPFGTLLAFSSLLANNIRDMTTEKIQQQAKSIYSISYHTFNLLEQILYWANSQSGTIKIENQKFNCRKICNEVIYGIIDMANVKNIEVNCLIDKEIQVCTDLNIFKTILRNLVSNAIKYTPSGGIVEVKAIHENASTTISVSDNGIGIRAEVIPKLWDIKEHIVTPGTHNEKGSGFGLILCKELIEKQNGHIWVESQPLKGSTFIFSIPCPTP